MKPPKSSSAQSFEPRPSRCSGSRFNSLYNFSSTSVQIACTCGVLKPVHTTKYSVKVPILLRSSTVIAEAFLFCIASMTRRTALGRFVKFKSIGPVYECIPPRARKQVRESLDPCGRGGECQWRKHRWRRFQEDRRWCAGAARSTAKAAARDRAWHWERPLDPAELPISVLLHGFRDDWR